MTEPAIVAYRRWWASEQAARSHKPRKPAGWVRVDGKWVKAK